MLAMAIPALIRIIAAPSMPTADYCVLSAGAGNAG
jgi:hypothetical protein